MRLATEFAASFPFDEAQEGRTDECRDMQARSLPYRNTHRFWKRALQMPRGVRALALALFLGAPAHYAVAAVKPPLNACTLLTSDDVFRLLGWTIESRQRKAYDVMGATGTMCFLTSSQGQVTVTVPDRASGYPGGGANDPATSGLAKHVYGLGGEVELYNSTAYVTRYHRSASIRVVPNERAASYNDVEGFARAALRHMH